MLRVLSEIRHALRTSSTAELAGDALGAIALMALIWAAFTLPWVLS